MPRQRLYSPENFRVDFTNTSSESGTVIIDVSLNYSDKLSEVNEVSKRIYPETFLKIDTVGTKLLIVNNQLRIWNTPKITGWLFHSVSVPSVVREKIKLAALETLEKSDTIEEYKLIYLLICNEMMIKCKEELVSSPFDLVSISSLRKKKNQLI